MVPAAIVGFCSAFSNFLSHAESSSRSLSDALRTRPIPLDSAVTAFLQSMERRVAVTAADLEVLDGLAFGTVSFEELLGHCSEVSKLNTRLIADIEAHFESFGYVYPPEMDLEDEPIDAETPEKMVSGLGLSKYGSVSAARSGRKKIADDDVLFENSMSLKNLGFSDACLAALSSQDEHPVASPKKNFHSSTTECRGNEAEVVVSDSLENLNLHGCNHIQDGLMDPGASLLEAPKDVYDQLPFYMKSLATWEELKEAVVKVNSYFSRKRAEGCYSLKQDDAEALGLGNKVRSFLLLLLRMNQLVVENVDGAIYYRLRCDDNK